MAQNLTTTIRSAQKKVAICRDAGMTIIGERINPTGRKALQAELKQGVFDIVRRDAVAQIEAGAAILDVNAGLPRSDEAALLVQLIQIVREVADDPPICIDTAKLGALEKALEYYCKDGAKPLVNSVTAEEKSLKTVLPLIKQYGAAVVGLCSGEAGIPATGDERVANADKIIDEAVKIGIPMEDIVIDVLVMTLGAKWDSGQHILHATKTIADKFGVNITMGASNISYGMPERELLTSYFLAISAAMGMNCPICNPLKNQEIYALMASDLILSRDRNGMQWIKGTRRLKSA